MLYHKVDFSHCNIHVYLQYVLFWWSNNIKAIMYRIYTIDTLTLKYSKITVLGTLVEESRDDMNTFESPKHTCNL